MLGRLTSRTIWATLPPGPVTVPVSRIERSDWIFSFPPRAARFAATMSSTFGAGVEVAHAARRRARSIILFMHHRRDRVTPAPVPVAQRRQLIALSPFLVLEPFLLFLFFMRLDARVDRRRDLPPIRLVGSIAITNDRVALRGGHPVASVFHIPLRFVAVLLGNPLALVE